MIHTARLVLRQWRDEGLSGLSCGERRAGAVRMASLADRSTEALQLMQKRLAQNGWSVLRVEDHASQFLGLAGLQPVRPNLPIAAATDAVWRELST